MIRKRMLSEHVCNKCKEVVRAGSASYCPNDVDNPAPTWFGFMEYKPPPPKCPYKFEHAVFSGSVNIDKKVKP